MPVALGLLESAAGDRWRFAGWPVSPERGLLCGAAREAEVWRAFARWLRERSRVWTTLDGEGLASVARLVPGARLRPVVYPALDLPDSFDEYLRQRPPRTRKRLKYASRDAERAGGRIYEPEDRARALRDFHRLHHERASQKGERHPQMNERLLEMLEGLDGAQGVRLRVSELRLHEDRVLGVGLHLEYRDRFYSYNEGIAIDAGRLSPGIVLELEAIRTAIARGFRRFDFGPGEYEYKTKLGGVPEVRFTLNAASPTLRGVATLVRTESVRIAQMPLRGVRRALRRA
jgi:CelD/BcsL family acetyltransferase involved in cellulose biosynthesis